MPNVHGNNSTEESTLDKIFDIATTKMHLDFQGDIEASTSAAVNEYIQRRGSIDDYDGSKEDLLTELRTRMEEYLPESFEYELDYDLEDGNLIIVKSGCPNCGNDSIFNGDIKEHNQWVGCGEHENGTRCRVDDGMESSIVYLSCGTCFDVLVDNRENNE